MGWESGWWAKRVDLANVDHLDSSALGTLVGLKVELDYGTPRVLKLLSLSNLARRFADQR
jgi:hypothetical protein